MSTATKAPASAGTVLERVERTAWRVPLPTRRLFVILAWIAAVALALSGIAAGWVAARNARTIDDARTQGLELATSVTAFRTRLAAADARAAATLIAGGLEPADERAAYDADVLAASNALTEAALVAREADRADISELGAGLVTYAGLVETSRANSRLGYPVGSAYLTQARDLANDDLIPRADRLRREGERRIARAANSVGGPISMLAVVLLVLALLVLLGCAVLIAGRTRRVAHPALVAAAVAVIAALAVVVSGITSQSSELRQAAEDDVDAFIAANEVARDLSNLRVTEISAVAARGSGEELYTLFTSGSEDTGFVGADELQARLAETAEDAGDPAGLRDAVDAYVAAAERVRTADQEEGNNQLAAQLALSAPEVEGQGSGDAYQEANDIALTSAEREADDLAERFDAAGDADIHPLVPIALGGVAAVLAAAGTLARGRKYR